MIASLKERMGRKTIRISSCVYPHSASAASDPPRSFFLAWIEEIRINSSFSRVFFVLPTSAMRRDASEGRRVVVCFKFKRVPLDQLDEHRHRVIRYRHRHTHSNDEASISCCHFSYDKSLRTTTERDEECLQRRILVHLVLQLLVAVPLIRMMRTYISTLHRQITELIDVSRCGYRFQLEQKLLKLRKGQSRPVPPVLLHNPSYYLTMQSLPIIQ